MVPGMRHCRGGDSPNTFDFMPSLVAWLEHGVAPERVVATQLKDGKVVRTRPLVPYPQVVRYAGKGDVNLAASWSIQTPEKLTEDNIDYLWGPGKHVR
jgi:feruloyl esterase